MFLLIPNGRMKRVQDYLDFLPVLGHQPLGTPPSNQVDLDDANTLLGVPVDHLLGDREFT